MDEPATWPFSADRRSPPPGPEFTVRWGSPGDIAAGVPHLLGFTPAESLVLIGLGGASGRRVGLTVRTDIPGAAGATEVADDLARSVHTDEPDAAVLVVVSEALDVPAARGDRPPAGPVSAAGTARLPHLALVGQVGSALAARRIRFTEALLVRDGRWWSYFCAADCCDPGAGTPLPGGVPEIAAAAVVTGSVLGRSRADLAARITGPTDVDPGMAAACLRIGRTTSAEDGGAAPADAGARAWRLLTELVARGADGVDRDGQLSDEDVARAVWALRDVRVRDRALGLSLGPEAGAAERLWTECTRRAPAPLDAAPATLLAVAAWLRGDGAMANVALERALAGDPGYPLAALLSQGLAACLPPGELRAMIVAALTDLGTVDDVTEGRLAGVDTLADLAELGGWSGPAAGRHREEG